MDEKIRKYRILAGFSQSEVASKINICKQSYCNKENGITDFTKKETEKIYLLFKSKLPELKLETLFNLN